MMVTRAIAVVLGIVGLYLNIWHTTGQGGIPVPLTHGAIGLGSNHIVHAIVGLVLLGAAIWLWYRAREMVGTSGVMVTSKP